VPGSLGNITDFAENVNSGAHNNNGVALVVLVGANRNDIGQQEVVNSMTYAGSAMTKAAGANTTGTNNRVTAEAWYHLSPASGSNTLAVTWNATSFAEWVTAISLIDVDVAAILDSGSNFSNGATSRSLTLTTENAGISLASLTVAGGDQAMNPNGTTTENREEYSAGHEANYANGYYLDDGVSNTLGWSGWVSTQCVIAGVSFSPKTFPGSQAIIIASRIHDFLGELKRGLIPPDELRRRYGDLVTI